MAKARSARETLGYKELKAEIRDNRCRQLYVLYGEETFLIGKLVESLTQLLIEPGSLSLDRVVYDGGGQASRIDPERVESEICTPPFLSRRKLVIVQNSGWLSAGGGKQGAGPSTNETGESEENDPDNDEAPDAFSGNAQKTRQEKIIRMLERLSDSACLVIIETKVDRRLKQLVSLIEQKGVLAEIGLEQPHTLQLWIEAECRRRGFSIEQTATESLIDRCDGKMQVIWQELNKLFLYCTYASCKSVDLALIAEISLPDLRGNIFDLTDALSDGRTEKALILVDTLIGQKQPVQLIQFMLARHIRQLICAAELSRPDRIAAELKVLPFVAGRLARQARCFTVNELENLYARCFETDMLVKTGQIGDRLALETLLVTVAEQAKKSLRR